MSQHFVTVCMVCCVLCIAHIPCSVHTSNVSPLESQQVQEKLGLPTISSELTLPSKYSNNTYRKVKRHTHDEKEEENKNIKNLFKIYSNGDSMTMREFELMLTNLGLTEFIADKSLNDTPSIQSTESNNSVKPKSKCLNKKELLTRVSKENYDTSTKNGSLLPDWMFESICPILLYHLANKSESRGCINIPGISSDLTMLENHLELDDGSDESRNMFQVWLYATISIIIISLCGLLGVAIIPFMGKSYYNPLLQFFVALGIGAMCGDALVHLLPHAMMPNHIHGHDEINHNELNHESQHLDNTLKGLTALCAVFIFSFVERALGKVAEWHKHRQRKNKLPSRVRVMRETEKVTDKNNVGEKLCKHKYSSYPYCYGEITGETREHQHNDHERSPVTIEEENKPLNNDNKNSILKNNKIVNKDNDFEKITASCDNQDIDETNNYEKILKNGGDGIENSINESESYTVIIREHENKHHGHTHSHGHVHSAPNSMSSVVWMVIMGDGLHNFTDGMAIGAAFSAGIAGGFSTGIAVLCHELPHELGDFAVLIKAGMSAKQAVFYNLLSSVLSFFGMVVGVLVGATPAATGWIFAAAAGMFIYIALVDMMPELSSGHSEEGGSKWQCVLQIMGLVTGVGVMLVIAVYEDDLKHIFSN